MGYCPSIYCLLVTMGSYIAMTPQEMVVVLLQKNEEEGRHFLEAQLPTLDLDSIAQLVYLLKRENDHQWVKDAYTSFVLSGHIIAISNIVKNKYFHAIGLWARGDALRRLHNDQDALPFLDVAGQEFLSLGDEVSW